MYRILVPTTHGNPPQEYVRTLHQAPMGMDQGFDSADGSRVRNGPRAEAILSGEKGGEWRTPLVQRRKTNDGAGVVMIAAIGSYLRPRK